MIKKHFFEVRELLSKNRIEEAVKIQKKLFISAVEFSKEEKYWFNLLSSEIRKYNRDYQSSKECLKNALLLAQGIELNDTQKSSLYGKIASTQYRLKDYSGALPWYQKALSLLSNDLGRQNYYRRMLLYCFYKLQREDEFLQVLKEGLDDIFRSSFENNWNSNMDFFWDIAQLAKHKPWSDLVRKTLNTAQVPTSNELAHGAMEYAKARLARYSFDRTLVINYIQRSLQFCRPFPRYFISLGLLCVWMLQNPFGEYQRAKNILIECLSLAQKPSQRIVVLNNLGSNLRFIGEYNLAIKYLTESLEINKSVGNSDQAAYAHNTLGMIHTLIGNKEEATAHYKSSLELSKENNDFYGLGFTYGALGWLEINQGNLNQAVEWYKTSVSTFKEKTNYVPAIILLAYAEALSRIGNEYTGQIKDLISRAKDLVWDSQKRLDKGRYYNTLGNIALNQKQPEQAYEEFSKALDYSESFEVESQALLGITKTSLELFMFFNDREYLEKAILYLGDLKSAAKASFLILGEVDLILGIIDMHKQRYGSASRKFTDVVRHAQQFQFASMEKKAQRQIETLQIFQKHDQLQEVITSSTKNDELKSNSIREAIKYLTDLTKILGTQTDIKDKD